MEKAKILNNKLFLYLTEFFSGMSVMAVELGASRLLAPYFSSSQTDWTPNSTFVERITRLSFSFTCR